VKPSLSAPLGGWFDTVASGTAASHSAILFTSQTRALLSRGKFSRLTKTQYEQGGFARAGDGVANAMSEPTMAIEQLAASDRIAGQG
jgi:hypothetical protein